MGGACKIAAVCAARLRGDLVTRLRDLFVKRACVAERAAVRTRVVSKQTTGRADPAPVLSTG